MSALVAVSHIGGAIFVLLVLAGASLRIAAYETERVRRRRLEEISVSLGVPLNDLEREEMVPRLLQLFSERFSSELLRNRLSDFCGILRSGWNWLGLLVQAGILVGAIWNTVGDDTSNAVHAWWAVGVAVFFWIASTVFSIACHLLTGRYPGEAKQARKSLVSLMQQRSAISK